MHLIGINGFKRSGKGTVADIVAGLYNDGDAVVKGIGFADKLKVYAARSLGYLDLSDQECIDLMDEFKERGSVTSGASRPRFVKLRDGSWLPENISYKPITGRQYLQNVGNEARKLFGDTFWIDMVLPPTRAAYEGWEDQVQAAQAAVLERLYPGVDCLCITDLRYPNEAERVKALGGVVWEVQRPGLESDGHASEQPLPGALIDYVIDNVGSIRDLEDSVERALDTLS